MGLRPRARVRVCKRGEPCIVEVLAGCGHGGGGIDDACSCRIGLAGSLARRVMIEPNAQPTLKPNLRPSLIPVAES